MIAVELRGELDTIAYRWRHTTDWTPWQLGAAVHAAVVRVHPFVDGNGRTTRLLADAVLLGATRDDVPHIYDWEIDRGEYLRLLRRYDRDRDPLPLSRFLRSRALLDADAPTDRP